MKTKLFTIPNILTLSNLLCGALGSVAALSCGNLTAAFSLMIAAAAFDFFDGFAARLLGQSGPLGLQLDSLADDISFGFLPASILYALYERMPACWLPERAGLAIFVLTAFAALRLAKFNIDEKQHTEFCGLPSPAAALFCGSVGMLADRCGWAIPREAILLMVLAVGLLMVSPVRMFALKFKNFGWKGNELRYSFLLAGAVLVAALRWRSIPVVIMLYVLVSCVRWLVCRNAADSK